ncbi:MAG: hypothetical protein MUO18_05325 [Methanomassiliicoccales archaeon]|jgi:hypothetical protein|nr:hypothetical protein [Methanomassiliicoccales archaeon]
MKDALLSKETTEHVMKAGTELFLALDSIIPESRMPADARKHYLAAKREFLLMMKSVIDANLEAVDTLQGKESSELKKIEVK